MIRWFRRHTVLPNDDLDDLSPEEASRRAHELDRREHEPELREIERELGSVDWGTASYYELLRRSLARFDDEKRPGRLREAAALGIVGAEKMTNYELNGAILTEQVRRNNVQKIRRGGG